MSLDQSILTADERAELELTALASHPLEEQYANLEQQHETAVLGMWVFLATEVLFFGVLFLGLAAYHIKYPEAFEAGSQKLNWVIGGINTVVLLVSSLTMVLAVHFARLGENRRTCWCLALTAALGCVFLCLKGLEYYLDYRENLIPGWRFDDSEWVQEGLHADQVPHVKLFLLFYWIMTGLHGLHVTIGIGVVVWILVLAAKGRFTPTRYTAVDVTALYWHFVDLVWIVLLPMLYLQGTHTL
ncbi:MAG TPA: cytochrome c oxidase subunit 3 family protein [Gemmataceae bacterium]|nr:cytochrome c oxidase subunit 3 family protein [Gemmataceae bacterium]